MTGRMHGAFVRLARAFVVALAAALSLPGFAGAQTGGAATLPSSNRVVINLGETPWRYLKDSDPVNVMSPSYDDSPANSADNWTSVGVPHTPNDSDTYLNMESGGGQGQLTGNHNWYRKHFSLDPSYANRKVFVEFEGAQMGAQVYINGQFLPGNSLVAGDAQATHVNGFIPFIVDLTPYLKFDGSDNVLAVKVSRGDNFFVNPNFSGAFRFGQAYAGLYRPVRMYITDRVYIPRNTYATLNTWGTYVSTLSASGAVADIRVQTNVQNEYSAAQPVTLNTQIVDASGNVVASAQASATLAANPLPATPAKTDPTVAPPPPTFDQTLTVNNPTLWYPNNSLYGKPYLYSVVQTVSINGVVVDATQTPLGIRTIAWDQNFPIINGHAHYLWGVGARYDWPALGAAVPEELKWRDAALVANAGGSLYRPGHSSEGPEFVAAADAYGIMLIQPSGDGENGFANLCSTTNGVYANGCSANADDQELKRESHRDMIVHDRNDPSILAWEADNGATDTGFAQSLKSLSQAWDPVLTRAQSDRTPNPANGDILGCSGDGCDIGVKNTFPNSPTWGSEYWGDGVDRAQYDWELAFAAPYVNNWVHSVGLKSFGIAHWYLADTPGEITTQIDNVTQTAGQGALPSDVRGNGASMMDHNRLPRLLYYIYESIWTPYQLNPVVKLAYHWNRSGTVRVNAFSNCPAVRLLINGQQTGSDQFPNPTNSDASADLSQNTTLLPGQAHWDNIPWMAGTLTAECLDSSHQPVVAANGAVIADQQVTAGPADHIRLTVEPELVSPNHAPFALHANGTDAALVTATVVDANNVRVPGASPIVTFSVTGQGVYRGSADHFVTANQGQGYHAPGDPNLTAEGGMTRVAVRTTFTPGAVTVTASSPGLGGGTASFTTVPITGPVLNSSGTSLPIAGQPASDLAIVTQPQDQTVTVGQTASFSVLVAGASSPSYKWLKGGVPIAGATGFTYTTPATATSDSGSSFSVQVTGAQGVSVASSPALLTVVQPQAPAIVTQPQPVTVVAGQNAQFGVTASGSPVLTYQWLRNNQPIAGATSAVYDTPILATANNGDLYSVQVTNSAGRITSNTAALTVAAATVPTIVSAPASQAVSVNQTVVLSVTASGTAPLNYQWTFNGQPVGANSATYVIPSAQAANAGSYTVTVTNAAGSVTSGAAVLTVSGSNGTNLALGKQTFQSGNENNTLSSANAVDGNLQTRWSSDFNDNAWMTIDLGSVQTFDQITLIWENAYGKQFQIQASNTNNGTDWQTVIPSNPQPGANGVIAGNVGTENINFPSISARYIRMQGVQRATAYGYSIIEFQVYDVPQCGPATERYTAQPAQPGTYVSPIAGIPNGPFVPTVHDNESGLTWQQYVTTYPQEGAQFTQIVANQYCASVGMRLPTLNEAETIASNNYASCAFPNPWTIWTSTTDPTDATRAFFESSTGTSSSQIINNSPGAALCVGGQSLAAPVITVPPASQTVALGSSARFSVTATGVGPFSYQWLENGVVVGITTIPAFNTAPIQESDDGASFTVAVSNGGGMATSGAATLTVGTGGTGTGGTGGTGTGGTGTGGTGTGGTGTTPSPSANLALKGIATASLATAGNPASAAIDGNLNSRWSSGSGTSASLVVDLGSAQTVNRVVLRWENAYGVAYTIDTSPDGLAWTTQFTQAKGQGGTEDITFPNSVSARYVRMNGTQPASQYGFSLYEFEIYNTAVTPQFTITASAGANGVISPAGAVPIYQGGQQTFTFQPAQGYAATGILVDGQSQGVITSYAFANVQVPHTIALTFSPASAAVDLALNKQTFQSGAENAGLSAANAVDGNLTTRWSSDFNDNAWMTVDFGAPVSFNRIVLNWQNAYGTAYNIQTSNTNNGNDWQTVFAQANGKGGIEDLGFTEVSARYVRFQGVKRSTGYGYSLWEFQVYDMPTPPAVTGQPASQTVQDGQSAQFTVTATGSAPLAYQWYENNALIGTTSLPSFTTAPLSAANDNNAQFWVVVSNSAGQAKSSTATVTVQAIAPAITTQPAAQTAAVGGKATFSVAATGSAPLTYSWYENGAVIGTTTTPGFTTPALTANDNNAQIWVVVSNSAGNVQSNKVALTVTGGGSTQPTQPASGNANLALTMATYESGQENGGTPSSNAVDGNLNTRWSSDFNDNAWMTIDLGSTQTFNRVVLRWENAYGAQYLIQVSNTNNGTDWQTVYTQSNGKGGTEDFTFAAQTARYVRMQGVKRASQYGYSLYEFEIYNTATTPSFTIVATASANGSISPAASTQVIQGAGASYSFTPASGYAVGGVTIDGQPIGMVSSYSFTDVVANHTVAVTFVPTVAAVDLALSKTTFESGQENAGNPSSNAVDGNLNTRWSSDFNDNAWITVDLGSVTSFNQLVLNWENAYGKSYLIQVSNTNNGTDWQTIFTQSAGKGGIETLKLPYTSARYIRMQGVLRNTPYGYSLWEFQLYNTLAGSPPPGITAAPQSQTVTVGQSATFSITVTGSAPFTYQWYLNGTAIPGANSATYTTPAAVAANSGEQFTVAVTDANGLTTNSAAATLTVVAAANGPVISTAPQSQSIVVGQSAPFEVAATGATPLTYQWMKNGTPIPGATRAGYNTPFAAASDTGSQYSVTVTDANGASTLSQAGTLSVSATLPSYTPDPNGNLLTQLVNNTQGQYADSQIYIAVFGKIGTGNQWVWTTPDGSYKPMASADNTAANSLTGPDGQSYPNYFFTLAQAKTWKLPPSLGSGRMWVSFGSPLYIKVLQAADGSIGYAGPNPNNAQDPNVNVTYDWTEFTYGGASDRTINVNTTQVDSFGWPISLDVYGQNETVHQQVGINQSRQALYNEFATEVPAAFLQQAVSQQRILAPFHASFQVGQPNQNYFASYVSDIWAYYANGRVRVTDNNGTAYDGYVSGGKLTFDLVDANTDAVITQGYVSIAQPTTQEILMSTDQLSGLYMQNLIGASINRHVMTSPSNWGNPAAYYQSGPANFYAAFWHWHGIGGVAYGFPYDDTENQSTLIQMPGAEYMIMTLGH